MNDWNDIKAKLRRYPGCAPVIEEAIAAIEARDAEIERLNARVKTLTRWLGWPSPSGLKHDMSELMKNAEKAAARVAEWSPAKQGYANRIINTKRNTNHE